MAYHGSIIGFAIGFAFMPGVPAAIGCPESKLDCSDRESLPSCCAGSKPECEACRRGQAVTQFCAENREYSGCESVCCDEGCSILCVRQDVGVIKNSFQCPWVVANTTLKLFAPVILEADVEKACPAADYGYQHILQCQMCAAFNRPCDDEYMACGGCCGTQWHEHLDLDITTHHTCPKLKRFFKTKNAGKVNCTNASQLVGDYDASAKPPHHGSLNVTVDDAASDETENVLAQGMITTSCNTTVRRLQAPRIPFKLKFECGKCNLGVPKLLKDCCDACVAWIKDLDTDPTLPRHIKGFGFCDGCDVTDITPVDTSTGQRLPWSMPWKHAGDYDRYTETIADDGMEAYIEEHVCGLLTPECGATTPMPSSMQQPLHCLPSGNGCSGGGRRMMSAANQAADANVQCDHFDASDYPSRRKQSPNETALDNAAKICAWIVPVLCLLVMHGI